VIRFRTRHYDHDPACGNLITFGTGDGFAARVPLPFTKFVSALFQAQHGRDVTATMHSLATLRDFATGLPFATHAFFACLCCLLLFRDVAPRLGLMDKPDARKRHDSLVPLVGGPAVFVAVAASIAVFVPHSITALFVAIAFGVLLLGLLDDRYDLPVGLRIAAQLLIAWLTVSLGGVEIHRIGNLVGFGIYEMEGLFAVIFSVICIVGVINSYNMIDGLDGLSASIALISFIGIGVLCATGGYEVGTRLAMIFGGALLGFLCLNARVFVPRARAFLGDSGSTLIGFSLAWFFISLTQSDSRAMSPVAAGWLFGLPLLDTVSVMVRRISQGISPMTAGRDHLHHRLVDAGLSTNQTLAIMCVIQAAMVTVGVLTNPYPALEPWLFIGFVVLVIVYHLGLLSVIDRISTRLLMRGAQGSPTAVFDHLTPAVDTLTSRSKDATLDTRLPATGNQKPGARQSERTEELDVPQL
jgi:UDP-GlcNAc:undecaprenyl-phosphate GlcNAc-1-phosphate transferase